MGLLGYSNRLFFILGGSYIGVFALELFGRMNIWKSEYMNIL